MIRKAAIEDCLEIYRLICCLEDEQFPFDVFQSIYAEQLSCDRFCCLVCKRGQEVVGMLNMRFERQLHHCGTIAEIMEFAIKADCRSQGIGKVLLEYACQLAENTGCLQIELASSQHRKDAHRFYQREGLRNSHFKFSRLLRGDAAQ